MSESVAKTSSSLVIPMSPVHMLFCWMQMMQGCWSSSLKFTQTHWFSSILETLWCIISLLNPFLWMLIMPWTSKMCPLHIKNNFARVLLQLLLGERIRDRVHNATPSISVSYKWLHVSYLMPNISCNAVNVIQWYRYTLKWQRYFESTHHQKWGVQLYPECITTHLHGWCTERLNQFSHNGLDLRILLVQMLGQGPHEDDDALTDGVVGWRVGGFIQETLKDWKQGAYIGLKQEEGQYNTINILSFLPCNLVW